MPYILRDFDGVHLPFAMTSEDLGTGDVDASLTESVGSVFDVFGSARRLPRMQRFQHSGLYVGGQGDADGLFRITPAGDLRVTTTGEQRITAASALRDLQAQSDALRAMIGVRGQLWRERIADGVLTWKLCRLLRVKQTGDVEDALAVAEVASEWETSDAGWRAATPVTVTGSGAIVNLVAANAGTLPTGLVKATIARVSGTITQVDITSGGGTALRWNGSVGGGSALVIDSAAQTVRVNELNAYNGLTILPGHTSDKWLFLRPGSVAIAIAVTGGTANVTLEWTPLWA